MSSISHNIRYLIQQSKKSVASIARETGINGTVLHSLVTGSVSDPKIGILLKLRDYFGVSLETILGETKELKLNEIPYIDFDAITTSALKKQGNFIPIPHFYNEDPNLFATRFPDNSMEPIFKKDSLIIIDPTLKLYNGCFSIIQTSKNEGLLIREVEQTGNTMILSSYKPKERVSFALEHIKCYGVIVEVRY